MLTLPVMGCDPHLDTIAAAVVDGAGSEIVSVTVPNNAGGWADLSELCVRENVGVVGVEGASGYGRCLSVVLIRSGVEVREVPTRLTARTRLVDGAGKTDPGDARTVGRAVARDEGNRWGDQPDLETIRVLTTRRNHLVTAQTADINHLRALLVEVDPESASQLSRLRSKRSYELLAETVYYGDIHRETVGQLIRDIAVGCALRRTQIRELEKRILENMPPAGIELIERIQGCGTIVAAQILSQVAGTDGFATDAKMAAWAGVSPLDASSGRQQRHRLNRGGNRQTNRAIHTIIITQIKSRGKAYEYVQRRISEGKTRKEAIRAAKRHTTRTIWKILKNHGLT
jgi:transposase